MTDTSSLAITHATTDSYPVHAQRGSPAAVDGAASDSGAPDEEPYTIKCICSFDEDDGNTVFCEGCETWQHILCYYPDKKVPDVHNCVDCEPRPLDNRRAHERQRQRRIREKSEDGDRKSRRPGPKTQKRKSNDADVIAFGHGRHDSSSREQPPSKKAKVSRRPSVSMSGISVPLAESRNRRSSTSVAMSPTSIPSPPIPHYSDEFLSLYDRDDQFVESKSILNYGVDFVNEIVAWLKDPQILARVTDGLSVEAFAKRSEEAMDRSRWPSLTTETITDETIEIGGKHPVHKILKTKDPVQKDDIVGEIFGKLGHVKDYKKLDSNRWEELGHAMPFVFFNRQLDLYIDSRQEGNELRHVRRSCEANVNLKIYITNGRQYHFCFVAKREIPANSEITTMWYFDDSFFPSDATVKEEFKDRVVDPKDAAICISTTLANFGGCACGNPQSCVLNKLDRRAKPPTNKRAKSKPKGKGKKPKSLGLPADIGRAGSETTKHLDEHDPPADARSTSGSARGRHTGSRDLSPTGSNPLTLPELSSRERRKIADAEKQFQQLEQLRTGNPKRKKRSSGPPTQSTPATVSSSTQTGVDFKPYHEPGVSRSSEMAAQSSRRQVNYVDAQTELYADDVERSFLRAERLRRGYRLDMIHPTLMLNIRWCAGHHIAEDWAQRNAWEAGDLSVVPSGVIPWWYGWFPLPIDDRSHIELLREDSDRMGIPADHGPLAMPPRWSFHQSKYPQPEYNYHGISIRGMHYDPPARLVQSDVDTRGVLSYKLESSASASSSDSLKPSVPPYWPSTAAHIFRIPGAGNRGNLRVSMPPPRASNMASALSPGSISTGSLASPSSHDTASPISLMPSSGSALAATPAKKKLSLGDYLIRRGTMATTPTSDPGPAPAPAPPPGDSRLRTQHFLAITTVFGDNHQPPHRKTEPGGDKNEPSDSPDISMEDAPEATPTKNPSISS
ncbi:Zinc finger FYVE/PHD-type [Penicillium samsonianum]|uniref:Zinc finger FYVE/PHD-type n=1 Tax=Penicillium samsonianum TaxID=1882272 RepID=UPI002547CEF4|nr:Zinc finger FYVE/PHD-type [Penicillium samsonianum]KAJ6133607.1 Zinc finger FYVE/PHD-type [Penicillium samsonianum]